MIVALGSCYLQKILFDRCRYFYIEKKYNDILEK